MFERKKQKVTVPTIETKQVTVPTVAGIKSALVPAATGVAAMAKHTLADKKEQGKAAVAPRLEDAKGRVEDDVLPRVADARDQLVDAKDQFVEETLPKIVEAVSGALAAGAAATSDAVDKVRDADAPHRAALLAQDAKGRAAEQVKQSRKEAKRQAKKGKALVGKEEKKGGFLSGLLTTLGLLAVAGGLAWFFAKKDAERDDPWARPLADPYVPPTTGRDSSVTAGAAASSGTTAGAGADTTFGTEPPTFTPSAGQVSEVPSGDHDLIPPSVDAQGEDSDIKVVDVDEAVAKTEEQKDQQGGL